jgi:hypothetical protein
MDACTHLLTHNELQSKIRVELSKGDVIAKLWQQLAVADAYGPMDNRHYSFEIVGNRVHKQKCIKHQRQFVVRFSVGKVTSSLPPVAAKPISINGYS